MCWGWQRCWGAHGVHCSKQIVYWSHPVEALLIAVNGGLVVGLLAISLVVLKTRRATCSAHSCVLASISANNNRLIELETIVEICKLAELGPTVSALNQNLKALDKRQEQIQRFLEQLQAQLGVLQRTPS